MNVTFYTFSKRLNSTKQPSGGTNYDCYLKEPSSVLSPVIQLKTTGAPTAYNYARISAFGRYYFVSDWTYRDGLWEAALSVDALASWKTNIGAFEGFILRCEGDYADPWITDTHALARADIISVNQTETSLTGFDGSGGTYVLRMAGGGDTGIRTYVTQRLEDFGAIFNKSLYQGDVLDEVAMAFFNPFDYVISLHWSPIRFSFYTDLARSSRVTSVKLKWFDCPLRDGAVVYVLKDDLSVAHPEAYDIRSNVLLSMPAPYYTDDFRRYSSAFSHYEAYIPGIGSIPISTSYVDYSLLLSYRIELTTGNIFYQLKAIGIEDVDNGLIGTYNANIYTQIQISSTNSNFGNILGSAIGVGSGIAGVASGNLGGAVNSVTSAANLAHEIYMPQMSVNGSMGNGVAIKELYTVVITASFNGSSDLPAEEVKGKPCMQNLMISTIPGYVQCLDGDISLPSTDSEMKAIKNFMEGGFFYE